MNDFTPQPATGPIDLAREPDLVLGAMTVRPSTREVETVSGREVLEPRVMQVLVALAQAGGAVVSRDELIARCWEGRIVGEDAINRAIGRLRRLAEAEAGAANFAIETIPRVGYRLRVLSPASETNASELSPLTGTPAPIPVAGPTIQRGRVWWLAGAIVLGGIVIALAAGLWWWFTRPVQWAMDDFHIIVSTPAFENSPSIAPNGSMIAYSAGPVPFAWHIYVRNLAGGDPIQLTNNPNEDDMRPVWSPDSSRVAFVRHAENKPCAIVIKPVPAGDEQIVTHCKQDDFGSISWAPDGQAIYYADRPASHVARRLMRVDLATGESTVLTHPPNDIVGDQEPSISPDGTKLAFARTTKGAGQQYVLDLKTGALQVLNTVGNAFPAKAWVDNSTVIFASGGTNRPSLWVAPLNGTPYRLAVNSQEMSRISAGPNNTFVVEVDREQTVLAAPPEDGSKWPMVADPASGASILPQYAADGTLAYAHISPGGLWDLWTQKPGAKARQITTLGIGFINGLRWSPDGTRLAFFGIAGQGPGIYIVNADGTRLHKVVSKGTIGVPAWMADSQGLIYPLKSAAGWQLWKVRLNDLAHPEEFSGLGWFVVQADGDAIYGLNMEREGIWRIDGKTPIFIASLKRRCTEAFVECSAWFVRGDMLVMADHTERARPRIFFHSIRDGAERFVVTPGLSLSDEVAVDPITGKLIYVYEGMGDSDIALFHLIRK